MGAEGRVQPVRVMLVEDNAGVRRALGTLLNAAGDLQVCGEAATVADAGPTAQATAPDVVIVDLRLPDGSGVQASRDVRASHPEIRVLLLTSASEQDALAASMLAGASGFLVKQLLGMDLVGAVRAVARGERLLDLTAGAAALNHLTSGAVDGLDAEILALVAEGRTNRQIGIGLGIGEARVHERVVSLLSGLAAGRRQPGGSPRQRVPFTFAG